MILQFEHVRIYGQAGSMQPKPDAVKRKTQFANIAAGRVVLDRPHRPMWPKLHHDRGHRASRHKIARDDNAPDTAIFGAGKDKHAEIPPLYRYVNLMLGIARAHRRVNIKVQEEIIVRPLRQIQPQFMMAADTPHAPCFLTAPSLDQIINQLSLSRGCPMAGKQHQPLLTRHANL